MTPRTIRCDLETLLIKKSNSSFKTSLNIERFDDANTFISSKSYLRIPSQLHFALCHPPQQEFPFHNIRVSLPATQLTRPLHSPLKPKIHHSHIHSASPPPSSPCPFFSARSTRPMSLKSPCTAPTNLVAGHELSLCTP